MIRTALRRLVREEDGIALVIALATVMVLSITTAGVLVSGAATQRAALVSDKERQAFGIAQEGLAYAEGCVYAAAATHTTPACMSSTTIPSEPVGSGTYYASVAGDGVTWTMHGSGTVRGVTRTITAIANVPSPVTTTQTGVWNYVYSDSSGCTTINSNVVISVPILVRGDLCLGGSMTYTGSQLAVGGNLTVAASNKAVIGTSAQRVATIRIGLTPSSTNTCTTGNNAPVLPGVGVCNGAQNSIWATSIAEGVGVTPTMPCIGQPSSWDPACTGANDGTWSTLTAAYASQAALPKSGCPTNLFDNDSTLNKSDGSISSVLLSNSAYDCKIGSAGSPCLSTQNVCELKWTPSSHTMLASGQFYFDGSLTISGTVLYTGQASFYFTGTVGTTGSPVFCGASGTFGGSNCTASWNPDNDGIVMIAACWSNSTGSTLVTTACFNLGGGATVQVAVYCVTQYTTAGGSTNWGPVLANSLNLGGNASTLIPFHVFPPGTPENTTTTYLPASAPSYWAG